jgi:UDP-glucose 4-epimerase
MRSIPLAPRILVTGGAGYIGSHTVLELIQAGYAVVVVDNLSNASPASLIRLEELSGEVVPFVRADVRDVAAMTELFQATSFDAVIHFAGLKAVGESVSQPLTYWDNNVQGTLVLLQAMDAAGVRRIVFSSSATVYGDPESVPIVETARIGPTNPYGRTKAAIETVLSDLAASDARWAVGNLRYFNPVGAHPSGLIGEDPRGVPNNLMPYIAQVAVGRRTHLSVFGDDWPTRDGTGVRDYIHVVDLAAGHLAALRRILQNNGAWTANLGTGVGYSVLEVIRAFEIASGCSIKFETAPRRAGDIASCFADPTHAQTLLGWRAHRALDEMCADHWRWQRANPFGYANS